MKTRLFFHFCQGHSGETKQAFISVSLPARDIHKNHRSWRSHKNTPCFYALLIITSSLFAPFIPFRLIRIFGLWSRMVCMNASQKGRPLYLAPGALMNYLCQSIGASHASQKLNSLLVCKLRDRKGRTPRNAEKQSSFAMFARDLQNSFIDKFEIARVTEMAVSRRPSRR